MSNDNQARKEHVRKILEVVDDQIIRNQVRADEQRDKNPDGYTTVDPAKRR